MSPLAQAAIEAAYRRYFPMIRAKCTRMLRDPEEASDVAQETFIRLWQRRADLDDVRATTAWLYSTATHLAIDHIRRGRWRSDERSDEMDAPAHGSGPEAIAHARAMLAKVTSQLRDDELEAAILSRIDGLTQTEIGEVMALSDRTVRRLLTKVDDRCARLARAENG